MKAKTRKRNSLKRLGLVNNEVVTLLVSLMRHSTHVEVKLEEDEEEKLGESKEEEEPL